MFSRQKSDRLNFPRKISRPFYSSPPWGLFRSSLRLISPSSAMCLCSTSFSLRLLLEVISATS